MPAILQGIGLGLRACHVTTILEHCPDVAWFEALTDNYLMPGGPALHQLDRVRAHYPMTLHGVGLSLGSTDPLNPAYLDKLHALVERLQPALVSEHLCWTSVHHHYQHELLPLPYTEEAVVHVADRIQSVQEKLKRRILIENVSSYLSFSHSTLTEWDFLNAVAERADCFILLDLNNIYVNAHNQQFEALDYVSALHAPRVKQFHLAGFSDHTHYLLDTHGAAIHEDVWALYQHALQRFGKIPTLIEWDTQIPDFDVLQQEANKAAVYFNHLTSLAACT